MPCDRGIAKNHIVTNPKPVPVLAVTSGAASGRRAFPARRGSFAAQAALVAQRVLPDAMTQLVVAEAERLGGLALVPAVPAQRVLEDRALMRIDRAAQVGNLVKGSRRRGTGGRDCGKSVEIAHGFG